MLYPSRITPKCQPHLRLASGSKCRLSVLCPTTSTICQEPRSIVIGSPNVAAVRGSSQRRSPPTSLHSRNGPHPSAPSPLITAAYLTGRATRLIINGGRGVHLAETTSSVAATDTGDAT